MSGAAVDSEKPGRQKIELLKVVEKVVEEIKSLDQAFARLTMERSDAVRDENITLLFNKKLELVKRKTELKLKLEQLSKPTLESLTGQLVQVKEELKKVTQKIDQLSPHKRMELGEKQDQLLKKQEELERKIKELKELKKGVSGVRTQIPNIKIGLLRSAQNLSRPSDAAFNAPK